MLRALEPEGASDLLTKVKIYIADLKGLPVRRFVALALALSLLTSGMSGCSQPIDTGSSVPAQSQPIVALLALLGLGIGLTAWHHHNEAHHGGGSSPPIFPAVFSVPPFISGYVPVDLVSDGVNAAEGALELPTSGGGTGKFTEIQASGGTGVSVGTETLAANYAPSAVAMDTTGTTWFVNGTGSVQECAAMTSSTTTCSSTIGPFSDGLGTGLRSISADTNFVFVVADAGNGTVKWWAAALTTSPIVFGTGTYSSNTTAPIYPADAVEVTTTGGGLSNFTVYHQDGSSDDVTFSLSGSTLTISALANMKFNPAPLVSLSNFEAGATNFDFYSFTGSATGAYSLTKFVSTALFGLTAPTATSELIDLNGQVGSPAGAPFRAPLKSIHFDSAENSIWAIDSSASIVNFAPF